MSSNLELFARMYAVSRDGGREPRDAARRAANPLVSPTGELRGVIYSDHTWQIVDIFDSCGHTQAVLERHDERGYPVRRTVTLTELRGV